MLEVNLNSYNNSWYRPGSKLKQIVWYYINLLFLKNSLNPFSSLKVILLKMFGAEIGKNVVIKQNVNVKYPWLLKIDDYSWIGENVWIDNLASVEIGKNCCLSQGALLLCGNHNYIKTSFDLIVKPILIKDGVWIGARAVVTSGVTCNEHSVLSVNSVATQNLESYTIYQGNPAKAIRRRIIKE
ncbi:putative colanic acid biosynthesis acetyltransferase WcaF [Flavobacteriaceae bacterium MAR_2010_188]|nr:putative colanic acid biosynthesis acetyltransferase WcaF [Flavobacteriaceae bacterium MAR_2010_188]